MQGESAIRLLLSQSSQFEIIECSVTGRQDDYKICFQSRMAISHIFHDNNKLLRLLSMTEPICR